MRKKLVNIVSSTFPSFFTKVAYDKLSNPQIRKLRENELLILKQSKSTVLDFEGFKIKIYEWGEEGEEVLLIHGWEGQAGNFSDLINKLLEKGFKVIAFDGPSHGFSSKGKTSLLEFSALVGELISKYKVKKLISHSFGGVATTYALFKNPALEIEKYALLTTPDKFSERIEDVMQQYGISSKVKTRLVEKLERENDFKVESLSVSEFVKTIKVEKSLIIHDKNDKVIPIYQSKNVHKNWANCEFEEIEDTGHFRILRTEKVINRVIDFLK